jgi:hypothetical protein
LKYTANYNLKKPEGTDTVNIEDFNNNADILDTEISSINEQIDTLTAKDNLLSTQINNLAAYKADLIDGKVPSGQLPSMNYLSPSGDGKDVTVTFTEAATRTNIATGEKLSVLFSKVKKYFTDLKTVAFTGNYSDLNGTPSSLPANGGTSAACSGNAATATKLQTARQINGVNFDGSSNIVVTDTTKASINHASTGTGYGIGNEVQYGHVALQASLNQAAFQNGLALSGHLGYVLSHERLADKTIWVGAEASKGTDANTLYFCY